MSKKQIMKNIQKDQKNNTTEEKDNYFKFITTLAILLILFLLSYFIIGIFYTKEIDFNKKDETKEEVNIDNNTIMIGQLFEQKEDEYYVLVYDMQEDDSSIKSWLSVYEGNTDKIPVYKVDSTKKFNSNYIVKKDSNKNPSSVSDLKVISPTLIKINNKKISEYIEGEDSIINIFKGNK